MKTMREKLKELPITLKWPESSEDVYHLSDDMIEEIMQIYAAELLHKVTDGRG